MAFLRKAIAATAVAGMAVAGAAGTAHATTAPPKPVHFTAYGPAVKKVHKKTIHLQTVTGTVKVTKWTTVTWKAVNKTYNKKTGKGTITVVFTYVPPGGQTRTTSPVTVKAKGGKTFALPTAHLKWLSVQVWQGKKHGAPVTILGKRPKHA